MNNGKICVPVCAEIADEFIENVKRAEIVADVIELRFDCLADAELEKVLRWLSNFKCSKKLLATFRQPEQGGKKPLLSQNHLDFWRNAKIDKSADWADFEFDLETREFGLSFEKTIRSFHSFDPKNFAQRPNFLAEFYEKFSIDFNDGVFKFAVQTNEIGDTIEVWKILNRARRENRQIIAISMGEVGKWTRILGLAHGAFLTFGALEAGKETAAGQISAADLIEVYRVKELDEATEVYGIIGGDTSYSMSPLMHNSAFKFHDLNAVFVPFEVKNLDEFIERFVRLETREVELNLRGFSVTIPHKQQIISYLDSIDEAAEKIGAVNTIKIDGNGKLHGFNTDAHGFIEPLKNCFGELKAAKVAILGNGGAARACVYALKQERADATIFVRNAAKAKSLADEFAVELKDSSNADFGDFDIVVNATPLGTKGALENETPIVAEQLKNVKLVYDLIYNPFETALIREARKANVPTLGGLAMLVAQGMKQFEIWTKKDAPMREMSRAVLEKLNVVN